MSRDVYIMKFSRPYAKIKDVADDDPLLPIGTFEDIRAAISKHLPGTDWTDSAWGIFDSPLSLVEFNLGEDEPPIGFMLHVRVSTGIDRRIVELCQEQGWVALDCSVGEFLAAADESAE